MIYKKNIRLAPTQFMMDVLVCPFQDLFSLLQEKYPGVRFEVDEGLMDLGSVWTVSTKKGTKILVYIHELDDVVTVAHEALHVTYLLDSWCGFNYSKDNEESHAYMHSYIMELILNLKK